MKQTNKTEQVRQPAPALCVLKGSNPGAIEPMVEALSA